MLSSAERQSRNAGVRAKEKQMRMRVMFLSCAIVLSAMLAGMSAGQAQDYPTRPVTVISPAAAGNSPDVAMRIVADRLSQIWKQQVVVINRPGAGGLIALQAAAAL